MHTMADSKTVTIRPSDSTADNRTIRRDLSAIGGGSSVRAANPAANMPKPTATSTTISVSTINRKPSNRQG